MHFIYMLTCFSSKNAHIKKLYVHIKDLAGGGGGGGEGLLAYFSAAPKGMFLRCYGLKTGIDFSHFGIGYGFRRNNRSV